MSPLAALLPAIGLLGLFLGLTKPGRDVAPSLGTPQLSLRLLQAATLWGVAVWFITETLSPFRALSRQTLLVAWLVFSIIVLLWAWRRRETTEAARWPAFLVRTYLEWPWVDRFLAFGVAVLVGAIGLTSLHVPPQESDAIAYHMGRVVHWAQNGSVAHYATADSRQLWMPPWASYVVLHLYLLSGGDRFTNLVQWTAMVGSLVAVAWLATHLGGSRRARLFAAVYLVTLPFGIPQASSALTDYVVAFWTLCGVVFAWVCRQRPSDLSAWLFLGFAVGLATLTKATGPIYLLPFLLWTALPILKAPGRLRRLLPAAVGGMAALVLNAPFWARNYAVFGSPLSPTEQRALLMNRSLSLTTLVANLTKNLALHLATPLDPVNEWLTTALRDGYARMGIDLNAPETMYQSTSFHLRWLWPGTDSAPVHLALLALAVLGWFFLHKRNLPRDGRRHILLAVGGLMLYSLLAKWQAVGRFQIPFFALLAAPVGVWLAERGRPTWFGPAVMLGLLVLAVPATFVARWRPIVGWRPYTATESIFRLSREDMLFAQKPHLREPYTKGTTVILESSCRRVGIEMNSHDHEYLLWWLLRPQENGIRVEHLHLFPGLEPLADPDFSPCAIVCLICTPDQEERRGLPQVFADEEIVVFLSEAR